MKRLTREHLVPGKDSYAYRQPAIEVDDGETLVIETINSGQPVIRSAADMAGEVTLTIRRDNRLPVVRPAVYTGDTLAFIASRVDRREAIRLALEDATAVVQRYSEATEEEARLYLVDTADLRNGGVFLEDSVEDIPT